MKESNVIRRLKESFPKALIGDDAAIVASGGGEILLAADAVVEGVHYDLSFSTLSQIMQKAISSNVSDIFAMGGKARAILVTAGMARQYQEKQLEEIINGLKLGCDFYGLKLVGGDTVSSPGTGFFNIAIMGEVEKGKAVKREGAHPGDLIVLTGECGGSMAGMELAKNLFEISNGGKYAGAILPIDKRERSLLMGFVSEMDLFTGDGKIDKFCGENGISSVASMGLRLIRQYLVPGTQPLDRSGLEDNGIEITSMIDISDGLGKDLAALCAESGVGAIIDEKSLPVPRVLENSAEINQKLITELVLQSGEEYYQIVTLRSAGDVRRTGRIIPVGEITADQGKVLLRDREGRQRDISKDGYEHVF
ncbi:thiamine-monophosphate kinase [bacterium]|nr:thiamine-monophosphate kinase [bacterium]